jgi:hypothetical protein
MDDQLPPPPTQWEMWQIASLRRKVFAWIFFTICVIVFPPNLLLFLGAIIYNRRKHKRAIRERGQ